MSTKLARALATWFGCGLSPFAPGTFGSIGALVPAYLLVEHAGWKPLWFLIPVALLTWPAIWAADVTAKSINKKDPGIVVVDEVLGQWVTLAGAMAFNWKSWLAAFLLFRAFDIVKPWPVRQLEALPGGAGINADDLMAGVYASLVLWLAGWFGLY